MKENLMKIQTKIEEKLIKKIDEILNDFKDFDQPFVDNNGNIIIRNKLTKKKYKDKSLLTNLFKEIIKNDIKKNRV